jgi:hypothetical protein
VCWLSVSYNTLFSFLGNIGTTIIRVLNNMLTVHSRKCYFVTGISSFIHAMMPPFRLTVL